MNKLRTCLGLLIMGVLVISVLGFAAALFLIPQRAEAIFGPPASFLSPVQRFTLSMNLINSEHVLMEPAENPGKDISFSIEPGDSASTIIQQLTDAGLIAAPEPFRNYLIYTGIDTRLKTGNFLLNTGLSPIEIAQAIQGFSATEATLIILAGWRLEEIAEAVPTSGLAITPEIFLLAARERPHGVLFAQELPEAATHEGFLVPGTYTLPRQATVDQLLSLILADFAVATTPEIKTGFQNQGLRLYEAVILASIVEREAVVAGEQATIASVFLNRLRSGMMLQADPTVQYALGYNDEWGWWKSPLSLDDLNYRSSFNTYTNFYLPPTPISNPSLETLQAIAFPAETNYFFFRAACDGSGEHIFAFTFEEHQNNACP